MRNKEALINSILRVWITAAMLLSVTLAVLAVPFGQEQLEDGARRLWDKRFADARARKDASERGKAAAKAAGGRGRTENSQAQTGGTKGSQPTNVSVQAPSRSGEPKAAEAERIALTGASGDPGQELIGVTFWRLRPVVPSAESSKPRLLVQRPNGVAEPFLLERVNGETPFRLGDRVRLSIEVPRETDGYLYVIDREVYADGTTSDPYLIFPAQSTPSGGNVVSAGRVISVPAQGDKNLLPYFDVVRSRSDHLGERLTIIVSPEPLPVTPGPPGELQPLDPALLARWERLWGGPTEQRQNRAVADSGWTVAEKEADEGKRRLVQRDALPQVIYCIKTVKGAPVLVHVPLWIAR